MEPIESFKLNEGYDHYGTHKEVTVEGDQVVTKLTFDAAPILKDAHAERVASAGERWGEGRKVGEIPMAVLGQIYQQHRSAEERSKAVLAWLRENPAFVTFEKFLKP